MLCAEFAIVDRLLESWFVTCVISPLSAVWIFWIAWLNCSKLVANCLIWSFCWFAPSNWVESSWIPWLSCVSPVRRVSDLVEIWFAPDDRLWTPFV